MSYSYDIGGLDLFADPFRSQQIQRTQVSRQQTKTSVMQPKAQATSMQQPKKQNIYSTADGKDTAKGDTINKYTET